MKILFEYLDKNYDLFDNLTKRLQEDYNGGEEFEQYEEDRLILCDILDLVDYKRKEKALEKHFKVDYIIEYGVVSNED